MSLVTTDRIKENCNVVGLNDITLAGTLPGYKSFSSVMNVGDTCYYSVVNPSDGNWEVGIGTLSDPSTLQRTTVNTSSNNNNKVVFASSVRKIVTLSFTAGQLATYYPIFSNSTVGSDIQFNFLGDSVYLEGETTNSNVSGNMLKFYRGLIYETGNSPTTYVSGSYVNVEDIDVWTYFKTINDPDNSKFSSGLYNYLDSAGGIVDSFIELDYVNGVTLRYGGFGAALSGEGFEFTNEFSPTTKSVKTKFGGPNQDFSVYGNSTVGSVFLNNYLDMQEAEVKSLREHTILANGPTVSIGFVIDPAGDTPSHTLYLANGNVDFIFNIGTGAPPQINEWPLGSRIRIILIQNGTVRLYSAASPRIKTLKGTGWDITCVLNAAGDRELFIRDVDNLALANITRADATTLPGVATVIRGDSYLTGGTAPSNGTTTAVIYNGFYSTSNTTEPTEYHIGRACITTANGVSTVNRHNSLTLKTVSASLRSDSSSSDTVAQVVAISNNGGSVLISSSGNETYFNGGTSLLGTKSVFTGPVGDITGNLSVSYLGFSNGTASSACLVLAGNGTHAQLGMSFGVIGGNITMLYGADSVLTQGYADTRYAGLGSNNLTGTQNLQDYELIRAKIRDYSETISSPTISSNTLTLDLEVSNIFEISLNDSITSLVINNPPASGSGGSFTLKFTADGTYRAINWGSAIKWAGNAVPTLTSTSGKIDVFSFFTSDGGTTWLGFAGGQNF